MSGLCMTASVWCPIASTSTIAYLKRESGVQMQFQNDNSYSLKNNLQYKAPQQMFWMFKRQGFSPPSYH